MIEFFLRLGLFSVINYKHMKKSITKIIRFLLLAWMMIVVKSGDILAQCAMCKASVETNVNEDGIGFASKLNFGILYLFATPYVLAMIIGYVWYKKSKEHKRKLEEAG